MSPQAQDLYSGILQWEFEYANDFSNFFSPTIEVGVARRVAGTLNRRRLGQEIDIRTSLFGGADVPETLDEFRETYFHLLDDELRGWEEQEKTGPLSW